MKKRISAALVILIGLLLVATGIQNVFANTNEYTMYYPSPKVYELDNDSTYKRTESCIVSGKTSYGKKSIGQAYVKGDIFDTSEFNNIEAYQLKSGVTIGYDYDNSYEIQENAIDWPDDEDSWFIHSDSEKKIASWNLSGKMKSGAVLVLTSTDGINYEVEAEKTDYFDNFKTSNNTFLELSKDEIKDGVYVKILVAYRMKIRTKDNFVGDEYDEYKYIEEYDFYLSYEKQPIVLYNIDDHREITTGSTVNTGFQIDFDGYGGVVNVKTPNGTTVKAKDLQTFSDEGTYVITTQTSMGTTYSSTIEVSSGLRYALALPEVYEMADSKGYEVDSKYKINSNAVFGTKSHTKLKIGSDCNVGKKSGFDAYGTLGDSLTIYLSYFQEEGYLYSGWEFVYDSWGKIAGENVNGVTVGEVGSGALIVQTSSDGTNWNSLNSSAYANGLYNTDVSNHYGTTGDIAIYSPSGADVINGIYIRVYYAYELKNGNETKNYIEKYEFYVCYDDLDAITIHNLSIDEADFEAFINEEDSTDINMLKQSESMRDGDYTVTGFTVDNKISKPNSIPLFVNAEIKYTKNGQTISPPKDGEFTEDGCYVIRMTSSIGTKRDVTIYVDTKTNEEALEYYFGNSFVTGKRVFDYGTLPVFEGASYNLSAIDQYSKPLVGNIYNLDTGNTITVSEFKETHEELEAGEYMASFTTWDKDDEEKSGDIRTFTFRFKAIKEGTAPGPMVNQDLLMQHSSGTVSNAKTVYYGLTYNSASIGNITFLFATKEEAFKAARDWEFNNVEKNADGTFLYSSSKYVGGKILYTSIDDVCADVEANALEAIQKKYIDYTEPTTFYTIRQEYLDNGLVISRLNLNNSIYIFGDGQRELMTDLSALPVVNDKPAYFVDPEGIKDPEYCPYSMVFIQDKNQYDSSIVTVTNESGDKSFVVTYDVSLQEQLVSEGFTTGKIKIYEENRYGDFVEYEAFFIEPGTNGTEFKINYTLNGESFEKNISQANDNDSPIYVDSFYLSDIVDELDPYGLVLVTSEFGEEFCMPYEEMKSIWAQPGEYTVICTNRLGYTYSIDVVVYESNSVIVTVVDEFDEVLFSAVFADGETSMDLPMLERDGYDLVGFEDIANMEIHTSSIDTLPEAGVITLQPVWQPKQLLVVYYDNSGRELETKDVYFGSTYGLEDYTVEDGFTFIGWKCGDEIYKDIITISEDKNYALIPVVEPVSVTDDSGEELSVESIAEEEQIIQAETPMPESVVIPEEQVSSDNSGKGLMIAIIVLLSVNIVAGGVVGFIFLYKKKMKK